MEKLQKELQNNLYETVRGLYVKQARDLGYDVEDYCEEYAAQTSENVARDCILLINSKNWDVPENSFYPFGFVMKSEYNITDKVQLLDRSDAADIVSDWFWRCFGTYNLLYNFATDLTDFEEATAIYNA